MDYSGYTSVAKYVDQVFAVRPDTSVAHYTSLDAMLSIVQGASIRATAIGYLNDASELTHAAQVAADAARTLASKGEIPSVLADWLASHARSFERGVTTEVFVACFSEQGDDLSQWRAYTPHGQGVSLIFSTASIRAAELSEHFQFGRCVYRLEEQTELVEGALKVCARELSAELGGFDDLDRLAVAFRSRLTDFLRLFALFKAEAFSAEKEWRAVRVPKDPMAGVKFRSGRTSLVPYVDLSLRDASGGGLAVSRVVNGPTANPGLARIALARCLMAHGVRSQRYLVDVSRVPFRQV